MNETRPPPCTDFTLTKCDEDQAVLFGGHKLGKVFNDVYLLELKSMVSCICFVGGCMWHRCRNMVKIGGALIH